MSAALTLVAKRTVSVEIGGTTIALHTLDPSFQRVIENRYAGFLRISADSQFEFDIDLCEPSESAPADDELHLQMEKGEWLLQRGNFRARWNTESRRGWIQQTYSSYAVDCVLAHRSHSVPGEAGRLPGSRCQRDSGRESVSFSRGFRRGQDNDFSSGATRRHAAHRRNLVCAARR